MKDLTKKELQESLTNSLILEGDLKNDLRSSKAHAEALKIDKEELERRITQYEESNRKTQDFFKTLEKIINGKSKPVSKIEVLKDLINPQQRIPYSNSNNWSSI